MKDPKLYEVKGGPADHAGWFCYYFVTHSEDRAIEMAQDRYLRYTSKDRELIIDKPRLIEWVSAIDEEVI